MTVCPIFCLMGPTAVGKTGLAIALAQQFPCDIISVDSAMVYRGMDIGTAKPTPEEQAQAPHRLIDICDPSEPYSAAQFVVDAQREIDRIQAAGRIPLLVGGTMLYFKALQEGLSDLPAADEATRQRIVSMAEEQGWEGVYAFLVDVDPLSAARIHPNDRQRVSRAVEVFLLTEQPMSSLLCGGDASPQNFINIAIVPEERAVLRQRITERFDRMLAEGFIEEARQLYERGDLSPALPSMRSLGYRQAWQYFQGEYDEGVFRQKAITASCQYAKRQLTWLRRGLPLHGTIRDSEDPLRFVVEFMAKLTQ